MIDNISDRIIQYIANQISYIDHYAGLVKPMRKMDGKKEKVFPVALNTLDDCSPNDYKALVPDSSKSCIAYLELIRTPIVTTNRAAFSLMESSLSLVIWYNLDKINKGEHMSYDTILADILKILPRTIANQVGSTSRNVNIAFTGIRSGSEIVRAYTYEEVKTQYNTHPYGIFAIDFDVWWTEVLCAVPITPESGCKTGKGKV
jgi:hypothetical protein